jgi:hypothetical protein
MFEDRELRILELGDMQENLRADTLLLTIVY